MSRILTMELPDEIYGQLEGMITSLGKTTEELVIEWVTRYASKPRPQLTETERQVAWKRLLRHMGAENLGYATGADNESIDADLAREYGSTHEEGI